MLAPSPDPFASIMYHFDIGPCKQIAKKVSSQTGRKISLTHVFNKMLGIAIAENPLFNQVILGNSVYQIEGIHISNAYLIPGTEYAIKYIVLDNPHLKPLDVIREELTTQQEEKRKERSRPHNAMADFFRRLVYRYNLIRYVGEKRIFTMAFERGIVSNIVFLNQVYTRPATFVVIKPIITPLKVSLRIVIKPIITPLKVSLRIHAHGGIEQTVVKNGSVNMQETVLLHVAIDHRILHGIHAHRFGETLECIASDPQKYLLQDQKV
jgi:hypothetical protein